MKEWEKQGVSKATYYRQKSHEESHNETKSHESHEKVSPVDKFNGTNGNTCGDITRAEFDKADTKIIPNWVRNGFKSKSDALDHAIKSVNESDAVMKNKLKGA